jgi:hypothetical protein
MAGDWSMSVVHLFWAFQYPKILIMIFVCDIFICYFLLCAIRLCCHQHGMKIESPFTFWGNWEHQAVLSNAIETNRRIRCLGS